VRPTQTTAAEKLGEAEANSALTFRESAMKKTAPKGGLFVLDKRLAQS
jgi:hypothetical protein